MTLAFSIDPGVDDFISQVAAARPTPGGGSVAALAGALAAALGEMMAGLTEGRPKYASAEPRVKALHAKLVALRISLRALVLEDPAAFQTVLDAMRLPKETDEERSVRDAAIQHSIRQATITPLLTARAVFEILQCLRELIEIGNPNVRCDLAVGALLAHAALKGAYYNVLANTSLLKDTAFIHNARPEAADLLQRSQAIMHQIDRYVAGA